MTNGIRPRKFVVTIWQVNDVWYWQLAGSNGRLMAVCPTTGYTSKRNAENAIEACGKVMTRGFYTTRVITGEQQQAA
jgi:uncharacterized protein YegP (UPF0339 family)